MYNNSGGKRLQIVVVLIVEIIDRFTDCEAVFFISIEDIYPKTSNKPLISQIMTTITNINGTSSTVCVCGSWLLHWQKFSKQSLPRYCPVEGCYQTDLVGAHVQRSYSLERKWFIIPLCRFHNASKIDLDVDDTIAFVPANKGETCEKF
ncbi:MAG: hypothetical protein JXB49_25690 [Bacteroidales bacterium]|nr:hypothetical protein [Bacteroidales bacterium]